MSTLGSLRVWLWLAVAVMLLFCFGLFAVAQANQEHPSSKPQQEPADLHPAAPEGQQTDSTAGGFREDEPPPGHGDLSLVNVVVTGPPANDNFANAVNASPTPFTDMRDTSGAITETGEPVPPSNCVTGQTTTATHSIWYKFTPPSNGIITADTSGSSYDTLLQAVTGSLGSFTSVACNDDVNPPSDLTSKVTFAATVGTQYFFMVSGFLATDFGTAIFHLSFTPTDFTVSAPSGAVTVNAGQPATFTITVSPAAAGFPHGVMFSASPLPTATTAAFNPTLVTPGNAPATTTLTITTMARSLVPPQTPQPPRPVMLLWLLAGLLGLASIALLRRWALYLPLALLVLFAASVVACGGGGGGGGGRETPPPSGNGTPAGTYTTNVTATSDGLSHATTVTLNVN